MTDILEAREILANAEVIHTAETVSAAMVEAEAVIARHFAARTLADVAKVWGERAKSASHPTDSPL